MSPSTSSCSRRTGRQHEFRRERDEDGDVVVVIECIRADSVGKVGIGIEEEVEEEVEVESGGMVECFLFFSVTAFIASSSEAICRDRR